METRWIVVCKDDDGQYVIATHRWWDDRDAAIRYAETVAPSRGPLVVGHFKDLRPAEGNRRTA